MGVDLSRGTMLQTATGSCLLCPSRDKIPTHFCFSIQRRPQHRDEVKNKECPPGDLFRLRDVGNLILLGHGNEVFMTHWGETLVMFVSGL